MDWHKIEITCPDCDESATITDVRINAAGEIRIDLECSHCEGSLSWLSTCNNLVIIAQTLDPPAIPANGMSEFDLRFMQAVHFKMDEIGGDSVSS